MEEFYLKNLFQTVKELELILEAILFLVNVVKVDPNSFFEVATEFVVSNKNK